MKKSLACILLLVWLLSGRPAAALPKESEKWIRAETVHFSLFSNAGKRRTLAIGQHLERLREVLTKTSPDLNQHSPLATRIYVFKNAASLAAYNLGANGKPDPLAGYFLGSADGNYVAVDASANTTPFQVIDHEYLHYVLRNNVPNIPLWLNEGLAEFYSSFTIFGGKAEIGRPLQSHLTWLGRHPPIPLSQLLQVDTASADYNEGDRVGTFYAQSWALAHFLVAGEPRKRGTIGKLFHLLNQGIDSREALETAYGKDLAALEQDLTAYMRSGAFTFFRYTPEEYFDEEQVKIEPLERKDLLFHLGDLLAHHPPLQYDSIEEHMRGVLALDDAHADAYATLALARVKQSRFPEAIEFCKEALKRDPDNGRAHLFYGLSLMQQDQDGAALESWSSGETPTHVLQARAQFKKSAERMPDNPEALAMFGKTFLYQRGTPDKGIDEGIDALARASKARPARSDILRDLIVLTARSGNRAGARSLFERGLRPRGEAADLQIVEGVFVELDLEVAKSLFEQGKPEEGLSLLKRIASETDDPALKASLQLQIQSIVGTARANSDIDRYNEASALAAGGDLEGAAALFEQVAASTDQEELKQAAHNRAEDARRLALHNGFVERFNQAVALGNSGSLREAIAVIEALLQENPGGELQASAEEMLTQLKAAKR